MRIINLLPPTEQKYLGQEKAFIIARRFLIGTVLSYLLVIAILVVWRSYLNSTLSNLDSDIQKAQAIVSRQDNAELKNQIDAGNNAVNDYNKLANATPHWADVLQSFAKLVPTDVLITNLTANTETGKIDITGVSLSRDSVLALRANIENDSALFKDVNLPLENLQKPNNLGFHYTFYLADNALANETNK